MTIERVVFPIMDCSQGEDLIFCILEMSNLFMRATGHPLSKLSVPESVWGSLYIQCMKHGIRERGKTGMHKIIINGPGGPVEVTAE